MPPRLRIQSLAQLVELHTARSTFVCSRCQYATAAVAPSGSTSVPATTITPAPSDAQIRHDIAFSTRHSTIQPPSHRDPRYRKSQLLRAYVSLLQSTPLIVLFQHNNLKALEWAGIRRELARALQKVDDQLQAQGVDPQDTMMMADSIKLQVVQTNILEPALRITEYYKPTVQQHHHQVIDGNDSSAPTTFENDKLDPSLTHALSESAYLSFKASQNQSIIHPLTPVLTGNIALLNFPTVSPQHVKAALSILSPQTPKFPAPTRKSTPSYHEPAVQDGIKKLMLLGARVDGRVFDMDGVRWIGGIEGGMTGLRSQLVGMLQGFAGGLAHTLESASRSVWFTMEGRRRMLEEEGGKEGAGQSQQQQ